MFLPTFCHLEVRIEESDDDLASIMFFKNMFLINLKYTLIEPQHLMFEKCESAEPSF